MADAKRFVVNGQSLTVADEQARADAEAGLDWAARLAACARGQGGQSLDALFASEIAAYDNFWQWIGARTHAADFTGILPGDYHDYTVNGAVVRARVKHIDPYYNCSDQAMGHHICWGYDQAFGVSGTYATNGDHIMWKSDNNNGTAGEKHPYLLSHPHLYLNSTFLSYQPSELRELLIEKRELLEERYSAAGAQTAATGWSWASMGYFWCFSPIEVFGHEFWATKGYSDGIDCQLDWFRSTRNRIKLKNGARAHWWLCAPSGANSTNACRVNSCGGANNIGVADGNIYLSPGFLTGGKAA